MKGVWREEVRGRVCEENRPLCLFLVRYLDAAYNSGDTVSDISRDDAFVIDASGDREIRIDGVAEFVEDSSGAQGGVCWGGVGVGHHKGRTTDGGKNLILFHTCCRVKTVINKNLVARLYVVLGY